MTQLELLKKPTEMTLEEAREVVNTRLDKGVQCPCCFKYVRRYRRKFNGTMAKSLLWLVHVQDQMGVEYVDVPKHAPRWLVRSNQLPTLRWWDLVERPDSIVEGVKHSGLWSATDKGVSFARGDLSIEHTCVTYNGNLEWLEGSDISIHEALGKKFDYREIMNA